MVANAEHWLVQNKLAKLNGNKTRYNSKVNHKQKNKTTTTNCYQLFRTTSNVPREKCAFILNINYPLKSSYCIYVSVNLFGLFLSLSAVIICLLIELGIFWLYYLSSLLDTFKFGFALFYVFLFSLDAW